MKRADRTIDAEDPTLPADVRKAMGQHLRAGARCRVYELEFVDSPKMLLILFEPTVGCVLMRAGSPDVPAIWGRVIPGEDFILANGPKGGDEGARLCHFSGQVRDLRPGELETCLGKIEAWARKEREAAGLARAKPAGRA